jgi:hypothetical protein
MLKQKSDLTRGMSISGRGLIRGEITIIQILNLIIIKSSTCSQLSGKLVTIISSNKIERDKKLIIWKKTINVNKLS